MADITARLIWYKLGEVREKMAEAGKSWYTELDFDSYVLDLLLLGWCTLSVVVIISVNALIAAFGPRQKQPLESFRETKGDHTSSANAPLPVESAQWFNSGLNWFYLHYYHAPQFVDDWLNALNVQVNKLGGPVQARFDRIQIGSLPPKITHVSSEASPKDRFIIHASIESRDLSFVVFASQQTHEGVKLTNVSASVLRLKGSLRVEAFKDGSDIKVSTSFERNPEIKVEVKPLNPYQDQSELVDLGVVEGIVRNSIILAKATFTITHLFMPVGLEALKKVGGQGPEGGAGQGYTPPTYHHDVARAGYSSAHSAAASQSQAPQQQPPQQTVLHQHPMQQQPPIELSRNKSPSPLPQQMMRGKSPSPMPQQKMRGRSPSPRVQKKVKSKSPSPGQHAPQQEVSQIPSAMMPMTEAIIAPVHQISVQKEPQQVIHLTNNLQSSPSLQTQVDQVPRRDTQRVRPQSRPEGVFEPVDTFSINNAMYSAPAPARHPQMIGDKRLLVKVIKASGLSLNDIGSASTVCMLSTDMPVQGYATSTVSHTQNPFWDEHFLFDITHDTQEVHVEIYDRAKPQGEDFIGESIVYIDDLRRTPSSRQILRLHPGPGDYEYNTGNVTVEFLFMDPAEADLIMDSMTTTANNQLSPRRRIEVARSVAPGGTLVTKTTTTTERPQYGRHDPGLDGFPTYVEKNVYAEESPQFSQFNNSPSTVSSDTIPVNGVNDSLTALALRELEDRSRGRRTPTKSSTVTITGVRRTIENYPVDDDLVDPYSLPADPRINQPQPIALKDDLELVRPQKEAPPSPNLKKSRTLGGSLKKLFRRRSKRSQPRGLESRESSVSRGSRSKGGSSRDSSLTRQSQREREDRAQSVS